MYVHHDIILPAFPLCTAWLDCSPKGDDKGNCFLYYYVGILLSQLRWLNNFVFSFALC